MVNAVSPTLPEGTPTASGTEAPLSITPLAAKANPVGSLLVRGKIGSTAPATKPVPLSIQGTGPLAAGTVGTSTTTATEGVNQGMASVPCQAPGSDFWFVGASGASGRRDVLVLTNLDSVNAEVNVTMYARTGPQDLPAARGIVVPARRTTELFLGQVATNLRDVALHVESTGGRVAPALRDNATQRHQAGRCGLAEPVGPARDQGVRAGRRRRVPEGGSCRSRTPSDLQATASLTVHGPNGPFKPAGLETVQVDGRLGEDGHAGPGAER